MRSNNVRLAIGSIRSAKWRSFFTMLGIIVGVVSVVTIVSLGEGVKREVTGQINHLGADMLTVRPGKMVTRDAEGKVQDVNIINSLGNGGTLSEGDLKLVQDNPNIEAAVPFSVVTGVASIKDRTLDNGIIIGTTPDLPRLLNQKVEFGAFFGREDADTNTAIIGKRVAEDLFRSNVPIGSAMQIRGQDFIVGGVFKEFDSSLLTQNTDYNRAIFVPYDVAKALGGGQTQIQQILVKPKSPALMEQTARTIDAALRQAHGGQEDYTILRQSDHLAIANKVLNLLTGLITGIAAISLLVGGIGIMNIMLVLVAERTHEIGIRKAIGATNRQILSQFMVESSMLSFIGGIFGVLLAFFVNYCLRVLTNLTPVITWQIVVVAVGVSLVVGIFFGVAPAMKAARKNPIDALRGNI